MSTAVEFTPSTSPASANGAADSSVTGLVSGIITDAQTLIRQQAELLKAELREAVQISKHVVICCVLLIICAIVSMIALVTALAYLLHEQFQFAMWASWGIVGGVFLLTGIAFGVVSYVYLKRFNHLSSVTVSSIQENLEWKTK